MPRPLRVFLCHASQDKPAVRKLHRYLKQHGIEPWLDELDLLPGENWEIEIPRALNASDVILVCLSKNSVNKEGYVQKEISFALDKALEKPEGTIFIIPAKLEDCDVPKRLNRYQWVDLFRPDSNKRLLLGLNKRAIDLGADVAPVILEDVRQRKTLPKPMDQNGLEKAQQAANEKSEREAAERIQRAKDELEAQEKIKREISENAAREKLKRETAEQAEIARFAQEAKEKLEHEEAEKVALEKAKYETEREAKRKKQREFITANSRWLGMGISILIILIFGGFGLNYLVKHMPTTIAVTNTSTFKPPTLTKTKIPSTITPQPAVTSTSQPTKIATLPYGIGSTTISEKDNMVMVYVPDGKFEMGGYGDEGPIHQVDLEAFWIDQTEVTNAMYTKCVDEGVCDPPGSKSHFIDLSYADHPVVYVNWKMANDYCSWAGRKLPTEAEWEKAARGINGRFFPWGDDLSCDYANYYAGFGHFCVGDTTKVGSYERGKSIYGAFDMAGNVWEWVSSLYQPYPYDASDGRENLSVSGPRVVRGGSWGNDSLTFSVNSSNRYSEDPSAEYSNFGFRCALSQ